jgi:hypothetical protein
MKSLLPALALVVALGVIAAAGWLLLRGEPVAPPPPPPPPVEIARRKPPPPPRFVPEELPPEEPPAEEGEPKEVPLPPDAYPWEVPGWWHEIDRRLREKEVEIDDEVRTVKDLLEQLERDGGFPVRAGPELEAWTDTRMSFPSSRGPIRAILEALASRSNVEVVLTADAVHLRQRGRAKEDRVTRAGRVQAAILEAMERRAGKREADPVALEFAATPVDIPLADVPLREAARLLGESLSIPVYMDAGLWAANLPVRVEAGERPLSKVLDALVGPAGGAWDVTPRRVVLFRPGR